MAGFGSIGLRVCLGHVTRGVKIQLLWTSVSPLPEAATERLNYN